jgi:hypothetical protein
MVFVSQITYPGTANAWRGLQWRGRIILAEAEDFVEAYHRLWRRAVRSFL